MLFSTKKAVNAYIEKVANDVIQKVTKRALELLQDNIMEYTYEYDYLPNKHYARGKVGDPMPTFDFLHSFEWRKIKKSANKLVGEIFQDISAMTFRTPDEEYEFGTYYGENGQDIRSELAGLLNIDGEFGAKRRKPFWDITINELIKNIYKWFAQELKPYGFVLEGAGTSTATSELDNLFE